MRQGPIPITHQHTTNYLRPIVVILRSATTKDLALNVQSQILSGVYPEHGEILRYAQDDMRRAQDDIEAYEGLRMTAIDPGHVP